MTELLQVEGLSKSFGKKTVMNEFRMNLEKGKIYGLLGKNGVGKTTLMRIIMGVIPRDEGTILYKGESVSYGSADYKKEIGYIPEDSFFYGWMTVQELLSMNSAFYPTWDWKAVESYLEKFSLDRREKIRNLSRGMKLKLGLISALSFNPGLLILDDPTSGLDVPSRQTFLRDIIAEFADRGTTILFASHMVHELDGLIDHLMIFEGDNLTVDEDYAEMKSRIKKLVISFEGEILDDIGIKNIIHQEFKQNQAEMVLYPFDEKAVKKIQEQKSLRIHEEALGLEEIFTSFVSGSHKGGN